jgi:aminopeptidase N
MKRFLFSLLFSFTFLFSLSACADNGDTLHVFHYTIRLHEVNTSDQSLSAVAELDAVSKINTGSFTLDLKALTADSVTVNGQSVTFFQLNDSLHILLQQPMSPGDTFSVRVKYSGVPFHENWGGYHWNGDYSFNLGVGFVSIPHNLGKAWFPCVDNFTDRASYDLYVTLATGYTAVCGGTLQEVTDSNGTSTWHWHLAQPIPTYLASVATGKYALVEDTYYGVEDTIPIQIFVRPADSSKVAGSFANLKTTMHFFEEKFGPYPFDRIGYVGTQTGAMEHATNIAYPNGSIDGTLNNEWLYTHELSHMWFGDKITCHKAEEMWINEGWASFCEMYYLEAYGKHDLFLKQMRDRNAKVLQFVASTDGGNYALADVPQNVTYGATSYDKGAVVVNSLRGYLGDSLFSVGVKHALKTLGYRSVNSMEWLQAIGEGAGVDLEDFAQAWVYTPGTPHFSIDSSVITPENGQYKVDIYLRQKFKDADFLADNNVLEVGFLKEDFSITTDTVHFSGRYGHSVKYIDFNPMTVMADPYERTDDATIDYFKIFTGPGSHTFQRTYLTIFIDALEDSALVRVTHHWVAPDSIKNPLPGMRFSQKRYWQVEGCFPQDMAARGKFYFSNSPTMDADLQLTDEDSVMIFYRANRSDPWHYIPQYLYGIPTIGYIYVEDLKPGEYALAAINKQIVEVPEKNQHTDLRVFPNPTTGKINLRFREKGDYLLIVSDTSGKAVKKEQFRGKNTTISLNSNSPGAYIISVYKNGNYLRSEKIILE